MMREVRWRGNASGTDAVVSQLNDVSCAKLVTIVTTVWEKKPWMLHGKPSSGFFAIYGLFLDGYSGDPAGLGAMMSAKGKRNNSSQTILTDRVWAGPLR